MEWLFFSDELLSLNMSSNLVHALECIGTPFLLKIDRHCLWAFVDVLSLPCSLHSPHRSAPVHGFTLNIAGQMSPGVPASVPLSLWPVSLLLDSDQLLLKWSDTAFFAGEIDSLPLWPLPTLSWRFSHHSRLWCFPHSQVAITCIFGSSSLNSTQAAATTSAMLTPGAVCLRLRSLMPASYVGSPSIVRERKDVLQE